MVYFTGDIHGFPFYVKHFALKHKLARDDTIVLLGDVGANYYQNESDEAVKATLSKIKPTVLCIHGNHEMRPWLVDGYHLAEWNGGLVYAQDKYPSLLFAKDGEIYTINGLRYIAIGGAYSVDKFYRLRTGQKWFEDEQPSQEIKDYVEKQLESNSVDVILSHTCPFKYEPREKFLPNIDQNLVDSSTERWLDTIEEKTKYNAWYCGHWHVEKRIDKMHFLFNTFESDEELKRGIKTNEAIS